jgi:hypothetical protein
MGNTIRMAGTYLLLLIGLLGAFTLIFFGRGQEAQAWPVILLILGALVRDAASIQSANSTERISAAAVSSAAPVAGPPADPE